MEFYHHTWTSRIFIRQKDGYSCGPIVLMNAYLWRLNNRVYQNDCSNRIRQLEKAIDLGALQYTLNTSSIDGTLPKDMESMMKCYFNNKQIKLNKYEEVRGALEKGYGVILLYGIDKDLAHYTFLFKEDGLIYAINNEVRKKVENYKTFEDLLKEVDTFPYIYYEGTKIRYDSPMAWAI